MSEKTVAVKVKGTTETAGLDELLDLQGGLKTITQPNLGKLKAAIVAEGFIAPVFIWARGKRRYILDGHQRCRALTALRDEGWRIPPLPVVRIVAKDLADAKRKLLLIASQYGDVDKVEAQSWILHLDAPEIRLMKVEIDLSVSLPTKDDDEVPETARARVQRGEVWQLGDHRLMCGDSTSGEDVVVLMDGRKAQLCFTSPPYWVGKEYEAETTIQEVKEFIAAEAALIARVVTSDGGRICINTGTARATAINEKAETETLFILAWWQDAFRRHDWLMRHCRLWVKRGGLAAARIAPKSDVVDQHWETVATLIPTFYNPDGLRRGQERVDMKWAQQGVWDDIHGAANDWGHGAAFPVELPLRYMTLYCTGGESVYEPFLGSGTTLIACEKTGRTCFGMEIDPHYCDVIIKRYTEWCRANDREAAVRKITNGDEDLFDGEATQTE